MEGVPDEVKIEGDAVEPVAPKIGNTRASVEAYLTFYGAVPDFSGLVGDVIATKQCVKFTCACGKPFSKALRNFGAMGPVCKDCRLEKNTKRFTEMAKRPKRPIEVVENPDEEKACTVCGHVKPMDAFRSVGSNIIRNLCSDCREDANERNRLSKANKKAKAAASKNK